MSISTLQWILVLGSSLILFWIAPFAKTTNDFFRGSKNEQTPGFWLLTSSLVISWIFAKSITNAANLGLSFGFVGGVAYAAYYLSFLVAGIIIYQMRVKGQFHSLHHFLESRYGRTAMLLFSLLIAFRLFNEVWSNTMVIGTYFGPKDSMPYYWAILVFTGLTLAYALKGGLRSSLLTDLIQMLLFGGLLFVILGVLLPEKGGDVGAFVGSGSWTLAGGLNLFFVAIIQVFSYPFHDPVLTDRAFIAPPKLTLNSFIVATFVGSICILLFSFVGIYAKME
ncbi:MAG: sodium:solute symporter, partial [Saprospiraceae bacterium]|nr:sodium:solute symporter [Saprospiraceae bacterium]